MKHGVAPELSLIRGRWQRPALRACTSAALCLALLALALPGRLGRVIASIDVGVVVAVPLLRVLWLAGRLSQERDWPYVVAGVGVLAIVAAGFGLSVAGVGR